MKYGNITEVVLEEIALSNSDPTSQQSIKKLSSYQDTFITNDEDLKIEYHKLPEISTQKNLPWYCYYLFISIIRETSSNIFSWVFIFSVWLPIVIFMAIPLYKPFLNSPTFNNYTFNVFKVYARLLEVSGEIYKLFLTYFETDNKCSLTPNDELLIGFNQIDFEGIPLILRIFIFYVILGMNFLFRFFLCNPKFHTNVFKVMTYNAKRELFKYSESYLCYVFVIAPLYLIANLLIDIYGMQSFNFEGVSFMSIPKYLIYNICQVPLYIISLNVFEVWFSSEYMTKSFFMKIANTIWIYLTLSAYCIAIVTFPRIFFKLIGYNNDDYSIKDMTPLLSYILTPFFNFSLLDLLSYSFVSIMVFITVFTSSLIIL